MVVEKFLPSCNSTLSVVLAEACVCSVVVYLRRFGFEERKVGELADGSRKLEDCGRPGVSRDREKARVACCVLHVADEVEGAMKPENSGCVVPGHTPRRG